MNEYETDDISELVASFRVVHLQPDDVLAIATDRDISAEQAQRVKELFGERKIVVLADGVRLGINGEGML